MSVYGRCLSTKLFSLIRNTRKRLHQFITLPPLPFYSLLLFLPLPPPLHPLSFGKHLQAKFFPFSKLLPFHPYNPIPKPLLLYSFSITIFSQGLRRDLFIFGALPLHIPYLGRLKDTFRMFLVYRSMKRKGYWSLDQSIASRNGGFQCYQSNE